MRVWPQITCFHFLLASVIGYAEFSTSRFSSSHWPEGVVILSYDLRKE